MRIISCILILLFILTPVFAQTQPNFWSEFDIVFWQTLPFAVFWGYAVANQAAGGGAINWSPVLNIALAVSAGNAFLHARKAVK